MTVQPGWQAVAGVAIAQAETRARGCARPIRLVGSTTRVKAGTGERLGSYSSVDELDGITYRRCQNRRAAVCPSCSHEYKGDAWHLLVCGLAGGKETPESVADHPATFATLTAPSFGPVHGLRAKGPCRARRDKPLCAHGRPLFCGRRHADGDRMLGEPLCRDCYDYVGHVLWQFHAPELWRRFTIALQRRLAAACGLSVTAFRARCRVAYAKVVEFQARGVIHVHVPLRLDGPDGPDSGPRVGVDVDADTLGKVAVDAATSVRLVVPALDPGEAVALRWGAQLDVRPISVTADRDGTAGRAHPEQVAAYLAKYLTKATEDFGLPARVLTAEHAARVGASAHAVRIIATAERLAHAHPEDYGPLIACLATLGYRGHPVTKSRRYSTTFGQLRRARADHRRRAAGLAEDAVIRELPADEDPDQVVEIREWRYAGRGYLDTDAAANAVRSACMARSRRLDDESR